MRSLRYIGTVLMLLIAFLQGANAREESETDYKEQQVDKFPIRFLNASTFLSGLILEMEFAVLRDICDRHLCFHHLCNRPAQSTKKSANKLNVFS